MCDCCADLNPTNSARSFSSPAPILYRRRVQNILRSRPCAVLEIGSGNLRNAKHLTSLGHNVTVVELPSTVERYKEEYRDFKRKGGKHHCWGTGNLNAELTPRFDVVLITYVLETICDPDTRNRVLLLAAQKMGPRGHLLLSTRGRKDVVAAKVSGIRCSDGFSTSSRTFIRGFNLIELAKLTRSVGLAHFEALHKNGTIAPELVHALAQRTKP